MLKIISSRSLSYFLAIAWALLLAACGGGGGGSSSTTSSTGTGTVTTPANPTLVLTGSTSTVSSTGGAQLSATLKSATGAVLPGVVVTFATAGANFGTLVPSSGTALTDSNGVATITLNAGTVSGADSVTATALIGTTTVTSNAYGFTSTTVATSNPTLVLAGSTTTVSPTTPATLTATLKSATGAGLPGIVVTFTAGNTTGALLPATGTALTDNNGVATITLNAGTTAGAGSITAKALVGTVALTSNVFGFTVTTTATLSPTLVLTGNTASISASTSATLTATLKNTSGAALPGLVVSFAITGTNVGVLTPSTGTALTDSNGVATITLAAGTTSGAGSVTATAVVGGVTTTSNVFGFTATGTIVPSVVSAVSLSASQTTVASDNSNTTTITAIVVDASNAAVGGATVTFAADSGLLSAASAITDATGKAQVTFSSGTTNPTSRTATITATTSGKSTQIPVRIAGAIVSLTSNSTALTVGSTATVTVQVRSASSTPLANQTVTLSSSSNGLTVSPTTLTTDGTGTVTAVLTAVSAGTATITATTVGETRTLSEKVTGASVVFQITSPAATGSPTSATIGTPITITVQAPSPTTMVTFVSTLGTWTANNSGVYTTSVTNGIATAQLTSTVAGVANVQVYDSNAQSTNDTRTIVFASPCSAASKVTLQSSPSVVAPSSGGAASLASLVATVTDQSGNPVVPNCPVAFQILNSTGGGESVSPAVALTSASSTALGQAATTFAAGSLPTTASGLQIRATVVNGSTPTIATGTSPSGQDATIVIGGTAGSVTIGRATTGISDPSNTYYTLAMSVLVADSNGNPVAGSLVSLSAWPIAFNAGGTQCSPNSANDYFNEDVNENLTLDAGEDGLRAHFNSTQPTVRGAGTLGTVDGQLTPPNSAAGTLPPTVTTNSSGVATFNLTYTKSNSLWITDRITARTLVQGTETRGTIYFRLPALLTDTNPCFIPDSPYQY